MKLLNIAAVFALLLSGVMAVPQDGGVAAAIQELESTVTDLAHDGGDVTGAPRHSGEETDDVEDGDEFDVPPLDYNDSDCLQDCPKCCDKMWNYFYGLCRDPQNPRGSLKPC